MYITGSAGAPPDLKNPHAIRWPEVVPFNQNALSNVPECTFFPVQSPFPLADPRSTVLLVEGEPVEKVAESWVTAPPMPCTLLQPVNANTWSVPGLAGSLSAYGESTMPVPAFP